MPAPTDVGCVCGHPQDTHQHFRPGTDCGQCGAQVCASFRPGSAHRPGAGRVTGGSVGGLAGGLTGRLTELVRRVRGTRG